MQVRQVSQNSSQSRRHLLVPSGDGCHSPAMSQKSPTLTGNDAVAHRSSGSKRVFALHFLEMVLVMLVGMGVFSGLAALAFGAAGSSL